MSAIRLLIIAAGLAWATSVSGHDAAVVTAPVIQSDTDVPYPRGARGDAAVVLELVVAMDGRVADVDVIDGVEPFAQRAREAARQWRFIPATRGGAAIGARIRARIDFREPHAEGAAEPATAGSPANEVANEASKVPDSTALDRRGAQGEAPAPQPIEISVRGKRREIGQTTLSAADVRQMPGAFGDAFRAVEALPGVTPALSGLPYFFVRGAPPNNNGYFLDGVRVPLLFHVAIGPSVVHPGLIESVDFYPVAAPASLGGFTGGIIAGQTRAPASEAHGEASLRLVDAGALLESPFANGRGTALAAGRYGYPGPILSAFSDIELGYWDYQSRVTWRASERETLSLLAFGSHDYLGHREEDGTRVEDLVSDFHRLDLRYDRDLADGRVRIAGTLGHDSQGTDPIYLTNRSAALRVDFEQQLWPALRLRSGFDARIEDLGLRRETPAEPEEAVVPSNVDPPPTNLTAALHADVVWRFTPRVEVVPGVRATLFHGARAGGDASDRIHTTVAAVDPRLSTRVTLAPGVTWLSTLAMAHQYPVLRVGALPAAVAAGAGFPAGSSSLQETLQASQGVELRLPASVTVTATGFLSHSSGLTDLTASCIQIQPPSAPIDEAPQPSDPYFCPSNDPVEGHAYGLELLIRRSLTERVSGSVSYTLSRSVREANFLTLDGTTAFAIVPSEIDRTHVLNAILGYDLGRHWRAGGRFVFYSGAPYSALAGNVPVPPYNERRDPPFFRLDVRLEKRWLLGPRASVAFVLEGQNVTLSKDANTLGMDCIGEANPVSGATTECERGTVGPITIPSIGVEAIF